jgi:hypothetical protein
LLSLLQVSGCSGVELHICFVSTSIAVLQRHTTQLDRPVISTIETADTGSMCSVELFIAGGKLFVGILFKNGHTHTHARTGTRTHRPTFKLQTYCTILFLFYLLLQASVLNLGHPSGATSLFDLCSVLCNKLVIQTSMCNAVARKMNKIKWICS